MPIDLRIQCISKSHRSGPHERIQSLGGMMQQPVASPQSPTPPAVPWRMGEIEALAKMNAGTHTFYTEEGGKRANVRIGRHRTSDGLTHEYLTTEADGLPPNALLALPDCPAKK